MKSSVDVASVSALNELANRIAERTGLTGLTLSHENLQRALTLSRAQESDDLESSLRDGHLNWEALIDALTVRETYFFRHPDQFVELRQRVLPSLHGFLRDHGTLRVWSAGCASGEEAYTLAIVLNAEGLGEQVQIVASDISGAALERGRSGQYRDWSLRSLSAELCEQHFRSENGVHHIRDDLRRNVVWRQLNLAKPSYPSAESGFSHFGLIFCRNVLMFFDAKTIQQVAMRLFASLLPGGWLVLGPSDPNVSQFVDLEVHVTPAGLMYRRPTDPSRFRRMSSIPPLRAAASELAFDKPVVREERRPVATSAAKKVDANAIELAEQVRAACNERGAEPALRECEAALARSEDAIELRHLHAILLWDLRRFADAAAAMRRVLYLDSDNAVAHFGLASLLERQGSFAAARRSYENALHACEDLAADAPLPLGDGICASGLQAAARDGLTRLHSREAGKS